MNMKQTNFKNEYRCDRKGLKLQLKGIWLSLPSNCFVNITDFFNLKVLTI